MKVTSAPVRFTRATVSCSVPGSRLSPVSAVRAETTIFAPSWPSLTAIASPMPRLAPVTSATLPFSVPAILASLVFRKRRLGKRLGQCPATLVRCGVPGEENRRQQHQARREERRVDADIGKGERRDLRPHQPRQSADRIVEAEILALVIEVDIAREQ